MTQDMSKEFAKSFYRSKAWLDCRAAYIASVHGLCERCLHAGYIVPGYIVHHRILLTPSNIQDAEVSLNSEHLEYLCHACHNYEHDVGHKQKPAREGLMFDINGNLIKGDG